MACFPPGVDGIFATLPRVNASSSHYFAPGPDLQIMDLRVTLDGAQRELVTAAGLFSADGLDKATAILLDHADELPRLEPGMTVLDLGCGWGPIALVMALSQPAARVIAVDVNEHARVVCRMNAQRLGLSGIEVCAPEEVPAHLLFDAIWSNPPIRIGKAAMHAMLQQWLSRLTENGTASMIVGKNLGADSLARWLGSQHPDRTVERVASSQGFRLLHLTGAAS